MKIRRLPGGPLDSIVHPYMSSSEQELVAFIDGLGQGFYSVDREWRVVRFNRLAAAHFRRSPRDVIGRVVWNTFPSAENTSLGRTFFDAMASRQAMSAEAFSVIAANQKLAYRLFPMGAGLGIVWHEVQKSPNRPLDAALDLLPIGIVRLGDKPQVASANSAALRILGEGDGLFLDTTVGAFQKADGTRLQQVIKAALKATDSPFSARLSIRRKSGRRGYVVHVLSEVSPEHAALLTIVDPEVAPAFKADELIGLYGLTRSEARVVWMLASCANLREASDRLGIAFETARTHIARARAKTQTSSQIDLVRLLASSLFV